jgi:hypothetical protein
MRVYAVLLATLVTALSAYTLELDRAVRLLAAAPHPAFDPTPIWYGGMLRPITVVAYSRPRPALAETGAVIPRATGLELGSR